MLNKLNELESEITGLSDAQSSALKALTVFSETALIYFSNQASRLSRKPGKNDPRTRRFKVRAKRNVDIIQSLEVQSELARIEAPDIPDDGALVYGRIVDRSYRGITGLSISAENERGKPLKKNIQPSGGDDYVQGYSLFAY